MKVLLCNPFENKFIVGIDKNEYILNDRCKDNNLLISKELDIELFDSYLLVDRLLIDVNYLNIDTVNKSLYRKIDVVEINNLEEIRLLKITSNGNYLCDKKHNLKINLSIGNIVDFDKDAVVNAANVHLASGGGVCGAIFMASGFEGLTKECRSIGWCDPGECVITNGYDLKVPFVIHTVGPRFKDSNCRNTLRNAYLNTLKLADGYFMKSIAMPSISTGTYGFPKDIACKIALDVIFNYKASYLEEITLVCFDFEMYKLFFEELKQLNRVNRIKGSMIAGAIGDALGYEVEFKRYKSIIEDYGYPGITEYKLYNGKALFSDDTQMTLFTANGILYAYANKDFSTEDDIVYIYKAYLNWFQTQGYYDRDYENISYIRDIKSLNSRRAPGNTCLNALASNKMGTIDNPINDSKGCGGVMRVAPIGLMYSKYSHDEAGYFAAEASAITHGHDLGYIPSYMLAYIIHCLLYSVNKMNIIDIINNSLNETISRFNDSKFINEFEDIILKSIDLSKNDKQDEENIRSIGEGWVAEEALAIAIYSVLKYSNDFDSCIICATNHSGDSDSTAAIAGNIIGAYLGFNQIDDKWILNLELKDLILDIAKDLYSASNNEDMSNDFDWINKYIMVDYITEQ